jgi:C4-dicarboxylate-specific signal transduction histidine kinase
MGLILFSFIDIMIHLKQMEHDGELINVSGRQRMLTQKISLLSLKLNQEKDTQIRGELARELDVSLNIMKDSHLLLVSKATKPSVGEIYFGGEHPLNQETQEFIQFHSTRTKDSLFPENQYKALVLKLDQAVKQWEQVNRESVSNLITVQTTAFGMAFIFIVLTGVLIYKQHRQEETIAKQRESLVSSSRLSSLGEMAGAVAHEINNPLVIINLITGQIRKIIKNGTLSESKMEELTGVILETVKRITRIINGLRTIARETDGIKKENIPLELIFEDVLVLCEERFKNHSIQLNFNPDAIWLKTNIFCDQVQISQVLLNLLNNAFDATESAPERWVNIVATEDNSEIKIRISDSGAGIPEKVREKIFQPFFTTKSIGKGTGLGLSLSYAIINDHGGDLSLDKNSPNTCFVIRLPKTFANEETG